MGIREILDAMERNIGDVVYKTLTEIHDFVLNDKNRTLRNHIENIATTKFKTAYDNFIIEPKKKTQNVTTTKNDTSPNAPNANDLNTVKIEIIDSDDDDDMRIAINESLVDQETTVSQSTGGNHELSREATPVVKTEIDSDIETDVETRMDTSTESVQIHSTYEVQGSTFERTNSIRAKPNGSILNGISYYCAYCSDKDIKGESYNRIQGVHKHWLTKHAKSQESFQFYIGSLCACHICNKQSNYREMQDHFKRVHPTKQFSIVDPIEMNKCGICSVDCNRLSDHFKFEHKISTKTNVFNPIRLSKEILNELISINIHKKFRCKICDEVFDTEHQVLEHHDRTSDHDRHTPYYDEFFDKKPPYFICGICNIRMDKEQLPNHFKNHELNCLKCGSFKGRLDELSQHNKIHNIFSMDDYLVEIMKNYYCTKIVYGNGLVLNNFNMLDTNDDESEKFLSLFKKQHQEPSCSKETPDTIFNRRFSMSSVNSLNSSGNRSDVLLSPGSSEDISEALKEEQLILQNEYRNFITISGFPNREQTDEMYDMFKTLCTFIGEPIDLNDVNDFKCETSYNSIRFDVEFKSTEKRNRILRNPRLKGLKSDQFLELRSDEQVKSIFVSPKMTHFYFKLYSHARQYCRNGKIYSFRICGQGLAFRYKRETAEVFVRSNKELDYYVEKLNRNQQKRKSTTPSPTQHTSKQIKLV